MSDNGGLGVERKTLGHRPTVRRGGAKIFGNASQARSVAIPIEKTASGELR